MSHDIHVFHFIRFSSHWNWNVSIFSISTKLCAILGWTFIIIRIRNSFEILIVYTACSHINPKIAMEQRHTQALGSILMLKALTHNGMPIDGLPIVDGFDSARNQWQTLYKLRAQDKLRIFGSMHRAHINHIKVFTTNKSVWFPFHTKPARNEIWFNQRQSIQLQPRLASTDALPASSFSLEFDYAQMSCSRTYGPCRTHHRGRAVCVCVCPQNNFFSTLKSGKLGKYLTSLLFDQRIRGPNTESAFLPLGFGIVSQSWRHMKAKLQVCDQRKLPVWKWATVPGS